MYEPTQQERHDAASLTRNIDELMRVVQDDHECAFERNDFVDLIATVARDPYAKVVFEECVRYMKAEQANVAERNKARVAECQRVVQEAMRNAG